MWVALVAAAVVAVAHFGIVFMVIPWVDAPTTSRLLPALRVGGMVFHFVNGLMFAGLVYWYATGTPPPVYSPWWAAVLVVQAASVGVALWVATHLRPIRFIDRDAYAGMLERRLDELDSTWRTRLQP